MRAAMFKPTSLLRAVVPRQKSGPRAAYSTGQKQTGGDQKPKTENPSFGSFRLNDIVPSRGGRIALLAGFTILGTMETWTYWKLFFGKKPDSD